MWEQVAQIAPDFATIRIALNGCGIVKDPGPDDTRLQFQPFNQLRLALHIALNTKFLRHQRSKLMCRRRMGRLEVTAANHEPAGSLPPATPGPRPTESQRKTSVSWFASVTSSLPI